jgi:hypothetical protein
LQQRANTTQTSITFSGSDGHTYGFYSIATDNVGNVQPTPTAAQATTTVDATPPTSLVAVLPSFSPGSFTLNWSGSDGNGSGIADYNVYVSDNGGAFTPLLTNTKQTSMTFAGVNGHTYGFYSVATDNVGNIQPTPSSAQSRTTIDTAPPTSSVQALPSLSPATFTLNWSGSDGSGSGIANYSVYVSDNGGAFTVLLGSTTLTSTTFTGQNGHIYGFFSIATDNVGNIQPTPTGAQASTTISAGPPTASLSGPSSGVLYQPLTFTLGASDPSPTDQAGNFTYAINWGDGSKDTVVGPSTTTDTHAYTNPGTYTVTLTATDKDGNVSPAVTQQVSVVATPQLQNGVLALPGTATAATFTLTPPLPTGASTYSMKVTETIGTKTTTLGTFAVPSGIIEVYGGSGTDAVVLMGTANSDAFTAASGTVSELAAQGTAQATSFIVGLNAVTALTLKGAGGSDSLTGPNQTNAWAITGANAGALNSFLTFTGIGSLIGGTAADDLAFANGGSVSATINGGGGSDTLDFSGRSTAVTVTMVADGTNKATATGGRTNIATVIGSTASTDTLIGGATSNFWALSGPNAGSLNGTLAFSGFENLTGGSTNDTFTFLPGGAISGNLNGAAPVNTLDYSAYGSPVSVNLATKTAPGIGGVWANIQRFLGTNTSDTLMGANANSTWSITGTNAGTVGSYTFAGFTNLTGGTGNDTFKFAAGGSESGSVDGQGGTNMLDLSGCGSPVTVNLQTTTVTGIGGTWSNIQSFKGTNTTDTLIATDGTSNNWALKGSNAGTVDGVTFTGFANLTGGSGNDTFTFASGATVSGLVDGRGGSNTLDYSAYTTGVKVNLGSATAGLANSSATGVDGGAANGIANISEVIVGANNNYLTAVGVTTSVTFTATGNDNNILVGGSGNNTLTASGSGNNIIIGGHGTSTISGGTGYNLLIGGYTDYDAVYADLQSILGIWKTVNSALTYSQAIGKLTASTYAYPLTAVSVHGNASDLIQAGTHLLDWYFASLASEITGENSGETITPC